MEIKPGPGRAELPAMLVSNGCRVGAEIGVQAGEHAEQLLNAGIERLWLVDLWAQQKDYFDIANVHDAHHQRNMRDTFRRMEAFPFRTQTLIGMSHEVAGAVLDESLDFCYLDGNHNLDSVRLDLAAWAPKVRTGGIISGHDFLDSENCCGSEFGVKTAVREFCEANGILEIHVCYIEPFPNWFVFKPFFSSR